jgi:molybdopterin-guanine dinucleotide biosynthesis protein A
MPGGWEEAGTGFDAVILAGGRASRLGGADKPGQVVGARTLAGWVVSAAAQAGAGRVIVVGPPRAELQGQVPGLAFAREEPAGAGPVPALRAGLAGVTAPVVAVLAADLPFLRPRHLARLLAAVGGGTGAVLADGAGQPQWLAGCWRAAGLAATLARYRGGSLRGLMAPLRPARLRCWPEPGEPPPWLDCDTWADLARARRMHRTAQREALT